MRTGCSASSIATANRVLGIIPDHDEIEDDDDADDDDVDDAESDFEDDFEEEG